MFIVRHFPNAITCCNLFCGCLSISSSFAGATDRAVFFILLAAVFDFFDGFAARLLKVQSPIGKELDSLADMVSFGVAPSAIMMVLLRLAVGKAEWSFTFVEHLPMVAFLLSVFAALRLAKFNIDQRQSHSFIGLPTPAMSLFVCALVFAAKDNNLLNPIATNPFVLSAVIIALSYLMVAELPLFALKFKTFGWKGNEIRFVFIALSVVMLAVFRLTGFAPIIVTYILLSVVNNIVTSKKERLNV